MAQTKRKRKHKHRGTAAGTIEARGRTSKPTGPRAEARKISSQGRRAHRLDDPPTWRGALNRSAVSAALFGVLVVVLFHRPIAVAVVLATAMVVIYLPMSYYTDRYLHKRRSRRAGAAGR